MVDPNETVDLKSFDENRAHQSGGKLFRVSRFRRENWLHIEDDAVDSRELLQDHETDSDQEGAAHARTQKFSPRSGRLRFRRTLETTEYKIKLAKKRVV